MVRPLRRGDVVTIGGWTHPIDDVVRLPGGSAHSSSLAVGLPALALTPLRSQVAELSQGARGASLTHLWLRFAKSLEMAMCITNFPTVDIDPIQYCFFVDLASQNFRIPSNQLLSIP